MPTFSSVLEQEAHTQSDGRRWVTEVHTARRDGDNSIIKTWRLQRLPAVGEDADATMLARVANIEDKERRREIEANVTLISEVGDQAVVSLDWSTAAENAEALRRAYAEASKVAAVMMADFLESLGDAALMAAFGWTQQQVDDLRANVLVPASALADDIRSALGV